jgi:hypothetical protein
MMLGWLSIIGLFAFLAIVVGGIASIAGGGGGGGNGDGGSKVAEGPHRSTKRHSKSNPRKRNPSLRKKTRRKEDNRSSSKAEDSNPNRKSLNRKNLALLASAPARTRWEQTYNLGPTEQGWVHRTVTGKD